MSAIEVKNLTKMFKVAEILGTNRSTICSRLNYSLNKKQSVVICCT
jgi:ABC-type antimicrobial peptide transport system ATPase subunit